MISCAPSLCAALLFAAGAFGAAQADDVAALLAQGRYADALVSAEAADGPTRHALRLRVLHHAGDLFGALEAGLSGLDEAPGDLQLLLSTADVALVLQAEAAPGLSARFDAAVEALPADTPYRSWWVGKAEEYGELAAAQVAAEGDRERAERRARWVAGLWIAAAGCGLVALSVGGPRRAGAGRAPVQRGRAVS